MPKSPSRLPEIVGKHLDRIKKSKASKTFVEAFETFVKSKARRPAYKLALDALRKISEPLHQKILRDVASSDIEELLVGMGPAHRNQRMRELRAVFNYGLKKKWADENPIARNGFRSASSCRAGRLRAARTGGTLGDRRQN